MKKSVLTLALAVSALLFAADSKYPSEEIIKVYELDISKADKLDVKTNEDVEHLKNLDQYAKKKDVIYVNGFSDAYHNEGVTVVYNDSLSPKEQFNYLLDAVKQKASTLEGIDRKKLLKIIELLRVK